MAHEISMVRVEIAVLSVAYETSISDKCALLWTRHRSALAGTHLMVPPLPVSRRAPSERVLAFRNSKARIAVLAQMSKEDLKRRTTLIGAIAGYVTRL